MFELIRDFLEFRKHRENQRICCKKYLIGQAMIKYYEDLDRIHGNTDLPPFIQAHNAMQELKSNKDVNRIYRKLEMAGLV